jgi:hypothetical protein
LAGRLGAGKTTGQLRRVLVTLEKHASRGRRLKRRLALVEARRSAQEREVGRAILVGWQGLVLSKQRESASLEEGLDLRAVVEAVADRLGRLREDLSILPGDSDGTATSESEQASFELAGEWRG